MRARRFAQHPLGGRRLELGELSDRADAVAVELLGRHGAHTPQAFHGKREKELLLPVGLHDQQPIGFAHGAGDLGQELGARNPDRDGESRLRPHAFAQPCRDLLGAAGDASETPDLEERLVDRQPLHERGGVTEDREHVFARRGVGIHARRDDDGIRAELSRLSAAHGGAHPARLRFVARRQHDPAADDHGATAQFGRIALLDRRVERVEVGVQHRRFPTHPVLLSTCGSSHELGTPAAISRGETGCLWPPVWSARAGTGEAVVGATAVLPRSRCSV